MTGPGAGHHRGFLLTDGGPAYWLAIRLGIIRANSPSIIRRPFLSILVTWVPLFALSTLQGNAIGHLVSIPFVRDIAVHARFLLAVPILLLAADVLGPGFAHAASHFKDSGLVPEQDYNKFDAAIEHGLRWRDSRAAELVLVLLAYALTVANLRSTAVHVSTWYALRTPEGIALTWAGWWFVLLSVPLLLFLILRWLWRSFLWAQFLWRMNRLELRLIPTHPDRAGGLAFAGEAHQHLAILVFAFSITVAGVLANNIIYGGVPFLRFAPAIAMYVLAAVALFQAPMLVFCRTLRHTKRTGLFQYGALATAYTSAFHGKWIIDSRWTKASLLGTADVQSLADLGNSYSLVEKMDLVPMGVRTPILLALACLIPMAPLVLTLIPFNDILKLAVKMLL